MKWTTAKEQGYFSTNEAQSGVDCARHDEFLLLQSVPGEQIRINLGRK